MPLPLEAVEPPVAGRGIVELPEVVWLGEGLGEAKSVCA